MGTGTPATAVLAKHGVLHTLHVYDHDPRASSFGEEAAQALGVDPRRIFKTLIASVDAKLVCGVIPVAAKLDLKRLAEVVGGKKAQLAEPAAAARATGYVVGGISPIAQKGRIQVVLDQSTQTFETIYVSAGKRGLQVELAPADLAVITSATTAAIAVF